MKIITNDYWQMLEYFSHYANDQEIFDKTLELCQAAENIYFVGNGGSASIASHIALDFWKNCGIKAYTFNDLVSLTACGNDVGYENVFALPIEKFVTDKDLVICISSSGNSENIIQAAIEAKNKNAKVISLVGFNGGDANLRYNSDIQIFIPCHDYGIVEILHSAFLHKLVNQLWQENLNAQEDK